MRVEDLRRPLAEKLPILSRFKNRTEAAPTVDSTLIGQAYSNAWDMTNYDGVTIVNDRIYQDHRVSVVTSFNNGEHFNTIWDVKKIGEIVTTELYLKNLSDNPQMMFISFGFIENSPQDIIYRDISFEEKKGKYIQKLPISKAEDMLAALSKSTPNKNSTNLSAREIENQFNCMPIPHHREIYPSHAQPLSAPRNVPKGIFA